MAEEHRNIARQCQDHVDRRCAMGAGVIDGSGNTPNAFVVQQQRHRAGVMLIANSRQQRLVRIECGSIISTEDKGVEAAIVRRRHHLLHFGAVGLDGEFVVTLEHVAHRCAFHDDEWAERRLK